MAAARTLGSVCSSSSGSSASLARRVSAGVSPMRATAITAAETGHLVFATLHTQDAPQTIDRIIDVFPPHQQQQVRVQLATTLQGIVTQQLLQTVDGHGRVVDGENEVLSLLEAKRTFLRELERRVMVASTDAKSVRQITRVGCCRRSGPGAQVLAEHLGGCPPRERLARSTVQRRRDSCELLGAVAGEVGASGEILAQQPVGVLVRAALHGLRGSQK